MRSTKDLKGMVSESRGRRGTPIGSIPEDGGNEERKSRGKNGDEYNFVKNQRVGGANYQSVGEGDETMKKLRKLEVLASADKETIETQQKKMHIMKVELEQLKQKYSQLKRNFDSVSLHAKKDAETNQQINKMKEEYEKKLTELTSAKQGAETELKDIKGQLSTSEVRGKEQAIKITSQTKEIDSLKKDLAKTQKGFESQLAQANASNKAMYEEKGRLMGEIRKMKDELKQAIDSNTQLQDQLSSASDSVRTINMLRQKLEDKDISIEQLQRTIGDMKGQLYEADSRLDGVHSELNQRSSLLQESRDQIKTLQVEKAALTQETKAQEVQIKNLLEELKLTKAAAGDSGTQLSELNKNLRAAQANADKFENEAAELKKLIESRTQNFLKEKAELKLQLDKALHDLKANDKNQNGIHAENGKLREEVAELKQKLSDTELKLEIIQDTIQAKVEELVAIEQAKNHAIAQMEKMVQEMKEIREAEEVLNQQLENTDKKLKAEQDKNDRLSRVTTGLQSIYEKMKVGMQPIEQTLSCLSCLEYLAEPNPHTLVCGHSICNKCFNQHSDPNSQDSLVFCEECKIETKNKQLRDSKVMKILTQKFQGQRNMLSAIEKLLSKL